MSKKIQNVSDLAAVRDKAREHMGLRTEGTSFEITVYMGTCCIAAGAREVLTALAESLESYEARNVKMRQAGCLGLVDRDPMITLTTSTGEKFLYGKLDAKKARTIVLEHIMEGKPVRDYLIEEAAWPSAAR
jgi:(2Fe-2S) ferredoxin